MALWGYSDGPREAGPRSDWWLVVSVALVAGCGDDGSSTADAGTDAAIVDAGADAVVADAFQGGVVPVNWSCVGNEFPPEPAVTEVEVNVQLDDWVQGTDISEAPVQVCEFSDPGCVWPLSTVQSDAFGWLQVSLPIGPKGFEGFIEAKPAGMIPTRRYPGFPITGPLQTYLSLVMLSEDTLRLGATLVGTEVDDTRGHVYGIVMDCDNNNAPGVTFEVTATDAQSAPWYLRGTLLSGAVQSTDTSGRGGWYNVPVGETEVIARVTETGQEVGRERVHVRVGTLTQVTWARSWRACCNQ